MSSWPKRRRTRPPTRPAAPTPATIDGQVTFDHVKFGYTPEKTVIRDFSCKVQPGQKVAIVGPTGAGKTTMVKLLMRFYDVDSGSITLNGHDVRDFDRSALREGFGMVLQDTWLFQGTIMENIRYGRLDATDEEVIAAAKAAGADHFIRTLPGGYQMELNEDASNVSQGQKQLLTIARTILADNRILVLGRGHQQRGHPHRAAHPGGHGPPDAGAHQLHHRPPAFHHPQCRPDPRHAGRRHCGTGHPTTS